ncbi:hypothetical protein EHW58_11660 [Salinivibrio sp. VYel1]|nr:hypothetical protein [Salinivibrio sp. VYel1]
MFITYHMLIKREAMNTGVIVLVIGWNGKSAHVELSNGSTISIKASHRPKVGDWVVEGELSTEL